jgi:tetratricopeptide (TPR) repeat protein
LQAKVPVGLLVLDPNGKVGVGCYFDHLDKGNIFFKSTQYADAKTEYYLALECPDVPDDNDLSKKIEDAGTCLDSKRDADDYYNSSRLENALKEYEKVYAINPQDIYTKERIELCNEKIAVLPRIIRGRITASENGRALADVSVLAEFYQLDKKGKVKTNKNGMPKMEWRSIGKTDSNGRYEVTVLNQTKNLKFYKRTEEIVVKPEANSEKKDDDVGQIVGLITNVAGVMRFVYSGEASLTNDEVNLALGKKIGL